jgi:hypothetical protein
MVLVVGLRLGPADKRKVRDFLESFPRPHLPTTIFTPGYWSWRRRQRYRASVSPPGPTTATRTAAGAAFGASPRTPRVGKPALTRSPVPACRTRARSMARATSSTPSVAGTASTVTRPAGSRSAPPLGALIVGLRPHAPPEPTRKDRT